MYQRVDTLDHAQRSRPVGHNRDAARDSPLSLVFGGVLFWIPAAVIVAGAARPLRAWLPAWPQWRGVDVPAGRQAATAALLVAQRRARAAGALAGLFTVPVASAAGMHLGLFNPLLTTLLGYATAAFVVEIWRVRHAPPTAAATVGVRSTARICRGGSSPASGRWGC